MPRLVLTVIGDDRSGLVEALANVVTNHGGNWEHSQMAELAGKFAGIVIGRTTTPLVNRGDALIHIAGLEPDPLPQPSAPEADPLSHDLEPDLS